MLARARRGVTQIRQKCLSIMTFRQEASVRSVELATTQEQVLVGWGEARVRRFDARPRGAHGLGWHRHRGSPGHRAGRRRDGAASFHRLLQPFLVDLADPTEFLADRAGLHLRDLSVPRLAASGVGRCAGTDHDRARAGAGCEMGDEGNGDDAQVVGAAGRLWRTS